MRLRVYRVVVWLIHRLIVGSVSAAELHGLHGLLKLSPNLQKVGDSSVIRDITCQLGTPQCRSKQRHRVVMFRVLPE
ncbi:hypothetical protein [Paenibacillus sp. BJ-4]|uniref:hypothetical protein n=1 Tax=Paenibacillus sp. BJ-4 TaxID=2878097 RepID=UPI001CF089B5|nr:hypothetical protein [Paenibacillus sp. BJ-4]